MEVERALAKLNEKLSCQTSLKAYTASLLKLTIISKRCLSLKPEVNIQLFID